MPCTQPRTYTEASLNTTLEYDEDAHAVFVDVGLSDFIITDFYNRERKKCMTSS